MPPTGAAGPPGPLRNKPGARISSSGAMSSNDDAGRKQRKADHRQEENQVAQVDHAALEAVEMRHHRERRARVDHGRAGAASAGLAQRVSRSVTGLKPARIRNRQRTTDRMKATTWLRVIAEVMQGMAR